MARAKRHYLPGLIWHITHRCHKREFLFRFNRDKRAWCRWILAAKQTYGLCILNYIITSNHIHLLIMDRITAEDPGFQPIPKSLHLAEARVAQEYNIRKCRSGAFWEDRYHATAVETGDHLIHCLAYIDLNMVRAKVVEHPGEWPFSGYYELQQPRQRWRNQLVDWRELLALFGMRDIQHLRTARREWVEEGSRLRALKRDPRWTESVAVGSKDYVEGIMKRLGGKAKGRDVRGEGGTYALQENGKAYLRAFGGEIKEIRPKNGLKK